MAVIFWSDPVRASHKLNKTLDSCLIEQRRDELVRRAAVADHGHVFVAEIEGMIPPSTVEDFAGEVLNPINLVGALWHITESNCCNQDFRVSEITLPGLKVDQFYTPVQLVVKPFCRDTFLLEMDIIRTVGRADYLLNVRQDFRLRSVCG